MPFSIAEKNGVIDLLQNEEQNVPVLLQLAKTVTKNVVSTTSTEEALEYIFTHTDDCLTLLNKKAITKEILFKYLHSKKVALRTDFTKTNLVKKVIEYWNETGAREQQQSYSQESYDETLHFIVDDHRLECTDVAVVSNTSSAQSSTTLSDASEFPINLLARKFSEWFFNNYNQRTLKPQDFWPDARLMLQITASDGCEIQDCDNAITLLETLYEAQQLFGFFFNPNLTHSGVQGRMDIHGLVLVLACGTLHTQTDCVGIFECTFGLMRDPFSENNWKTKTIQLMLRSKGAPSIPSLEESDTLKEALTLPVPKGDLG
ncbi:uncharacterized protein C3orf38 homolog [Musca vetustissima]|uniref:uncharacterized protein C3orf38 homolog n=1 Tax=Musca vetustissima TaxID=27455 RepID=UPI002AB75CA7|nr:uncharacterized protein C3orf38 homolog [Musca vetustissima]